MAEEDHRRKSIRKVAHKHKPSYRQYLGLCFTWSRAGGWGLVGTIALLVGFLLAFAQAFYPHFSQSITPRMNAVLSFIIPIAGGASVFVARLCLAPYFLWKSEAEKVNAFEEKEKANIDLLDCPPQDSDNGKGRVFLLGIKNTSANDIEQCSVRLINIKTKTRDVPCNDALTFQPSEREPSTERTLHPDDLNVIDVIYLFPGTLETVRPGTKVNGVVHYWNKSERFRSYFTEHGPYILSVAITGKHLKTLVRDLRFTYAGNTGMLEVMPPQPTSNL